MDSPSSSIEERGRAEGHRSNRAGRKQGKALHVSPLPKPFYSPNAAIIGGGGLSSRILMFKTHPLKECCPEKEDFPSNTNSKTMRKAPSDMTCAPTSAMDGPVNLGPLSHAWL